MRFLQRIGEENPQPLARRHGEISLRSADLQGQFQVANGVGRHQQLEPEQARQQMISHVIRPDAAEPLGLDGGANRRNRLAQERAGARRGIKNQHARAGLRLAVGLLDRHRGRVGETVGKAEAVAQQMIHAAHDVGDDRLGRVVDAAYFPQFRIVSGQEVLVEMDHRVFLPGAAAEIGQNRRHVRPVQEARQIVHDPGNTRVDVGAGDAAKDVAQERRRFCEDRFLSGEALRRLVLATRREQAVGCGLSLQVGEIGGVQILDQGFLIGAQQAVQRTGLGFLLEDTFHAVTQQPRLGGDALGQLARVVDGWQVGGEEPGKQDVDQFGPFPVQGEPVFAVKAPEACYLAQLAFRVPAKFQVVGEDQIGQAVAVAAELFIVFNVIQMDADVLAFDVACGHAVVLDDKVRSAAGDMRRLVEHPNLSAAQCFDQGRKSRTVTMLGRLPGGVELGYLVTVGPECVEGHGCFTSGSL